MDMKSLPWPLQKDMNYVCTVLAEVDADTVIWQNYPTKSLLKAALIL